MRRRNTKGPEEDFGFEFGRELVRNMDLELVVMRCEL